ncbi:hypothetical protein ACFVXE_31415 [Streptomyces sp. NPDC058231]
MGVVLVIGDGGGNDGGALVDPLVTAGSDLHRDGFLLGWKWWKHSKTGS